MRRGLCAIGYDGAVRSGVCLSLLTVLWALGTSAGHAQVPAAGPLASLHVVVWLFGDADGEFLRRLQGQTVDLPVVLQPEARDGPPRTSDVRLRQAQEQAGSDRAVVYREPLPGGGIRVCLYYKQRIFARDLSEPNATSGGGLGASAAVESAALILRSAFRALLAGEALGSGVEETLAKSAADGADRSNAPDRPPLHGFFAALKWQLGIDGVSPQAGHALGLSAGFVAERWLVRGTLLVGIPALVRDALSVVALSRHQVSISAAWVPVSAERLRLQLALSLGLCGYLRATQEVDPSYEAAAPRLLPALCLAPQLGLWLRPTLRLPLFIELEAGADVLWGQPRLGYVDGASFREHTTLWPLQPVWSLALLWVPSARAKDTQRTQTARLPAPASASHRRGLYGD